MIIFLFLVSAVASLGVLAIATAACFCALFLFWGALAHLNSRQGDEGGFS